jgi:hypothetical protein
MCSIMLIHADGGSHRSWLQSKDKTSSLLYKQHTRIILRRFFVPIHMKSIRRMPWINRLWMFKTSILKVLVVASPNFLLTTTTSWISKFRTFITYWIGYECSKLQNLKVLFCCIIWALLTQKSKLNHESINSSTWKLGNLDRSFLVWTPPEPFPWYFYSPSLGYRLLQHSTGTDVAIFNFCVWQVSSVRNLSYQ